VEQLEKWAAKADVNQAAVKQVFRKQAAIITCTFFRREQYEQKLAYTYLHQQHPDRDDYELEKKQELMDAFIADA
jgi:hypothetical protein